MASSERSHKSFSTELDKFTCTRSRFFQRLLCDYQWFLDATADSYPLERRVFNFMVLWVFFSIAHLTQPHYTLHCRRRLDLDSLKNIEFSSRINVVCMLLHDGTASPNKNKFPLCSSPFPLCNHSSLLQPFSLFYRVTFSMFLHNAECCWKMRNGKFMDRLWWWKNLPGLTCFPLVPDAS